MNSNYLNDMMHLQKKKKNLSLSINHLLCNSLS